MLFLSLELCYAQESEELTQLKKAISLLQSQVNALRKNEGRLGEIRYSILPLEEFQKLYGKSWVLMDGSCIAEKCPYDSSKDNGKRKKLFNLIINSEYKSQFNGTILGGNLPDLRGRFLRMLNQGEAGNNYDPSENRKIGSFQSSSNKKHSHHIHNNYSESDCATKHPHFIHVNYGVLQYYAPNNVNDLEPGERCTHVDSTKSSGTEPESRPINIAVNVYIKVD